ncbi:MAG: histone [Thermoproteota archaeon]|nr:MAG: histone [Candidatus Korarchaeota archaeon]RLG49174.1 MAG: histone [Candidatus Korarchaeota archaeon]
MPSKPVRFLPLAPIYRMIKEAGAERVSNAARSTLAYHMEKFGMRVAKQAVDMAHHARRKTVTDRDIELAVEAILGR